jgi:NADPH:quinone reductase-like Zn-dependent oxidoreductase
MKAVMFDRHGGTDVLQYRDDLPVPTIGPNDVLLRIKAAAMNYNCLWARQGLPGMDVIFPHINGTDGAGVVHEVGSAVTEWKVGDEVIVHGGFSCGTCYECLRGEPTFCPKFRIWGFQTGPNDGAEAEYARVPARHVVRKPSNLTFEGAAALGGILLTAWRMLVVRARIQPGDFVLIWGASGGLGTVAIQICKVFGAKSIAIAGNEEKCRFAAGLGADFVLDRSKDRIPREVLKITQRKGVDIVFEHTGASTWETSTYCLKWGGTIVTCGATTGFKAPLDIRFLWNKEQNYLGSHYGNVAQMIESLKFAETGQIKPVIGDVLPLKDVVRAHEALERGDVHGKIVLIPE